MLLANVKTQDTQPLNWSAINWRRVNNVINNLRKRIYRASAMGEIKRVRNLQKLMLRSHANKLLAIRRVTHLNQGKNTPGVDKVIITTSREREELYQQITNLPSGKPYPVKRVYILKKNGKPRPLGIPAIIDRCRQAMIKSALEPYWEAKFEATSFGFRPGRSAQDAIQKIFCIARAGKSRKYVLDADIKGAFDNIDHQHLINNIGNFPARELIKEWLQAGVMQNGVVWPTESGCPQGGIISPLLCNIALHGMEELLDVKYNSGGTLHQKAPYALVRYADDFVVFARSPEACGEARQRLKSWLAKRGLELSEEKTQVKHLTEGFDFLGFTIRHYPDRNKKRGYVLLIKPSKKAIKSHKQQMKQAWRQVRNWPTKRSIEYLNYKIRGWVNYFRSGSSSSTFSAISHWMWIKESRYVRKRHPNKHWWWLRKQYWGSIKERKDRWVFMDKKSGVYLWKHSWTPIKRHILVKGNASPDDGNLREYWRKRQSNKAWGILYRSKALLWKKQNGNCQICRQEIDNQESIHFHHIIPKKLGGKDKLNNLVILHAECHRQLHSKQAEIAEVNKLLEPDAG